MPPSETDYSEEWFRIAAKDFARVGRCLSDGDVELAADCLQQALEKYLKGYLLQRGWFLRRIHDLEALLDDAIQYDPALEIHRSLCQQITKYYMLNRYPLPGISGPTLAMVQQQFDESKKLIGDLLGKMKGQQEV